MSTTIRQYLESLQASLERSVDEAAKQVAHLRTQLKEAEKEYAYRVLQKEEVDEYMREDAKHQKDKER